MSDYGAWAAQPGEILQDGWEPGVTDPALLRAYVEGFADMSEHMATGRGGRVERDDRLCLADAGSPAPYLNAATLLRPIGPDDVAAAIADAQAFFASGDGGPWMLLSAMPLPSLEAYGMRGVGHPPFMVRGAGGERRDAPSDLEIVEVDDRQGFERIEAACRDFYPVPELVGAPPGSMFSAALVGAPDYRWFLGVVGGEPVGTAMAHRTKTCLHVEWITSDPSRRGKGYGEAMTWEATLAWPDLPATLIASDAGHPTYTRMGYLTVMRVTMWAGARRPA
jgi:hypothetical protein